MVRFVAKLIPLLAIFSITATMAGCSSLRWLSDGDEPTSDATVSLAPALLQIVYRTKTDRLNLAGADLPPCSMATLQIQVPHPHYKADAGFAQLTVLPTSVDADLSPGNLVSRQVPTPDRWAGDIPLWQLEAIVQQLEEANFFRRAKILGAETYLSVSAASGKLGRPYREVPELDAMMVRLSQAKPPQANAVERPELARLPTIAQR